MQPLNGVREVLDAGVHLQAQQKKRSEAAPLLQTGVRADINASMHSVGPHMLPSAPAHLLGSNVRPEQCMQY